MPILVKETPAKILYNPRIIPSFIATDRSLSTRLPLTFYHKRTLSWELCHLFMKQSQVDGLSAYKP